MTLVYTKEGEACWSRYYVVDDFGNDIDLWNNDHREEQAWLFVESEQEH